MSRRRALPLPGDLQPGAKESARLPALSSYTTAREWKGGDVCKTFWAFLSSETGQSVAEYAVLFSLVTLALIGACSALGLTVGHLYAAVRDVLP